ncbi:MAG: hypothetical protein IPF41_02350 [Flavobacteriales bacterium]|nr:hypothetical protein [Flavobacteriales bacterium]
MRHIRFSLAFFVLVIGSCDRAIAQDWASMHMPGDHAGWGDLYMDEVTGTLYTTGLHQLNLNGSYGVFAYNGAQWDTIGLFAQGFPKAILRYNDTLLVAGGFYSPTDGMPDRIAYLDSSGWNPYGEFDGVINRLRIIDGELYAVGSFELVDGQACDGIVKRMGGHWEPVGDFGDVLNAGLYDVIKYNGDLVACGNMGVAGPSEDDVFIYENGSWSALGGGLLGSVSLAYAMAIYNNELIMCGQFYLGAGNAGHCIMRWNGSIWQPLGVGITDSSDSYQAAPSTFALAVQEGKLFVGGGFWFAGHVPAQGVAVWDGDVWCGLGAPLPDGVFDLEFYNDTLVALCAGNTVDGQYNSGVVRYLHTTYNDTCSLSTGMAIAERLLNPLRLMLWMASCVCRVKGWASVSIIAPSGQSVRAGQVLTGGGRCAPIPIGTLGPGVYLLRITGCGAVRFTVGD